MAAATTCSVAVVVPPSLPSSATPPPHGKGGASAADGGAAQPPTARPRVAVVHPPLPTPEQLPPACALLAVQVTALSAVDAHIAGVRPVVDVPFPAPDPLCHAAPWVAGVELARARAASAAATATATGPADSVGAAAGAGTGAATAPSAASGPSGDDDSGGSGLGFEVAGTVVAVGPDTPGLSPGMDVVAVLSVGDGGGGVASHVVVSAASCLRRPTELAPADAASVLLPGVQALHALQARVGSRAVCDASVVVTDAGSGHGLVMVQVAVWMGARVLAVTADDAQADAVREFTRRDAVTLVDPRSEDVLQRVLNETGGVGAAAVIDLAPADSPHHLSQLVAIQCLAVGGTWLTARVQDLEAGEARLLFLKSGCMAAMFSHAWLAAPAQHGRLLHAMQQALHLAATSVITPAPGVRFAVDDAAAATAAVATRTAAGRVLVTPVG